jgi:hypothetical protein
LKKNAWSKDAQMFFDNSEVLRINIIEENHCKNILQQREAAFISTAVAPSCRFLKSPLLDCRYLQITRRKNNEPWS